MGVPQKIVIVLAALACVGEGSRVKKSAIGDDLPTAQSFAEVDESAVVRADRSGTANPLRSIAMVFLVLDPTAAFKPGVPGVRSSQNTPVTASRYVAQDGGNRLSGTSRLPVTRTSGGPKMSGSLATYEKLAADCLEEGCPVLTVEELLIQLKAVANPNAKLAQEIKDLESKLAEVKAEQDTIEKLVAEVAASETLSTGEINRKGKADPSLEKLAANCIEEGCPVLTVEELLAQLKFANDPSPKLADTIKKLETSLQESKAKQSDVEKLVESVAGR